METYITLEELETILPTIFTTAELNKIGWETLSNSDKMVYLLRSCDYIDMMRYRGRKYEIGQLRAFPRIIDNVYFPIIENIRLATASMVFHLIETDKDVRYSLQKQGVTSIKSGDEAETYDLGKASATDSASYKLFSSYLSPFLYNGVI